MLEAHTATANWLGRRTFRVVPEISGRATTSAVPQQSRKAVMADSTSAAAPVASVPSSDDLQRAEDFTREPFLHEGETLEDALAPARPG